MGVINLDGRPLASVAAREAGDGFSCVVVLSDFDYGPLVWTGATIEATAGGTGMTVDSATDGWLLLSLTGVQTAALGVGEHPWTLRITLAGGQPQTYINGALILQDGASNTSSSTGCDYGVVGSVLVGIA